MTSRARVVQAGIWLALLYVLAALATGRLSSRPVLPLFDGFVPPTPYAWVNPPPERAGDNVVPKPTERTFTVGADGVAASNASTDDGQAIVGLDKGTVPAHPPDGMVSVRLIPTDAGTLGPLPPGLRVVSNAYKVEMTYLPSQTPVGPLPVPGTIALTAADVGDRLLYSSDGQTWQQATFRPYGQDNGLFTELGAVGYYVVASSVTHTSGGGGGAGALRGVLLVLAGVVPIVGAILVLRLRSPVPTAPASSGRAGRRPPGKAPQRNRKKPRKPRR